MRFGKEINQALKIILVFAVFTFVFKLIEKLSPLIFVGINNDRIKSFIETYLIWFTTMILIIVGLCMYIKKTDGKFNLEFIYDPMIRSTSGLLIIFLGIFNLSISIPVALLNIKTIHHLSEFEATIGGTSQVPHMATVVIPSMINLVQVLLGTYLVLHKKRNKEIGYLD